LKYIEGKAKFGSIYEVAFLSFSFFFLGETLTKTTNSKNSKMKCILREFQLPQMNPKDFLIFGQIFLLEPYPLYDLKSLMMVLLLLLLLLPHHAMRDMNWSKKKVLVCCLFVVVNVSLFRKQHIQQ
jgi:hypothetical protein